MTTQRTSLRLINFSGKDIETVHVKIANIDDWGSSDTCPGENFGGHILNGDTRYNVDLEINLSTWDGCWFTVDVIFSDKSTLTFRANQWDAYSPPPDGNYTQDLVKSPENAHLSIFQTLGQDRYTYSNSYYIRETQEPDNSNWMSKLMASKSEVLLNQVTMPGSHDAGMYTDVTDKARTQTLDVKGQLKAGARYFDLRIYAHNNGDLYTYHSIFDGGKLSDILDNVKTFLAGSPDEVIFLKFRSYAERDQQSTVNLVTSKLDAILYKSTTTATPNFATQTLRSLKGKVVAAFTSDYARLLDSTKGLHLYSDYGNEDTGEYIPHMNDDCLGVYDSYSHQSEFEAMIEDQWSKFNRYGSLNKPYLFLLSWTLTGSVGNVMDIRLLSSYANPRLPDTLSELSTASADPSRFQPNIVYIDHVDPYLCSRIIDNNL